MSTKKITLAFVALLTTCAFQACNGNHDKTSTDSQSGQPTVNSSASGNDSSHTTDNRRKEASGVDRSAASGNTNANGTTTAQGMTGADSVYQKGTQKSPR